MCKSQISFFISLWLEKTYRYWVPIFQSFFWLLSHTVHFKHIMVPILLMLLMDIYWKKIWYPSFVSLNKAEGRGKIPDIFLEVPHPPPKRTAGNAPPGPPSQPLAPQTNPLVSIRTLFLYIEYCGWLLVCLLHSSIDRSFELDSFHQRL